MSQFPAAVPSKLGPLSRLIFASRWLQLPLYVGLILAQGVYVFHFWVELVHLIEAAMGDPGALALLIGSIGSGSATGLGDSTARATASTVVRAFTSSNVGVLGSSCRASSRDATGPFRAGGLMVPMARRFPGSVGSTRPTPVSPRTCRS